VLLLLYRSCGQRTLLAWSGALLLLPFWLNLWRVAAFVPAAAASAPRPPVADVVSRAAHAYLGGGWYERFLQNFHDWSINNADGFFTVIIVLAWFLAGLFLWRSGFVESLLERKPLLNRICLWCLILSQGGLLLVYQVHQTWRPSPARLPALLLAATVVRVAATAAISIGYAAGITLFTLSGRLPRLRQGLQTVGRTALSNYMLQSIVGTAPHAGYGLGLYARVGALHAMLLSVLVFVLQMPLSAWYLTRLRTGPGRPAAAASLP
jgi:uncharacterized protein